MRTNNHVESFKKKVHQSYNRRNKKKIKTLMPHLESFFIIFILVSFIKP